MKENNINKQYFDLLPMKERTQEALERYEHELKVDAEAIVLGEVILTNNKFIPTNKSRRYARLVRGIKASHKDRTGKHIVRPYFNVPIKYKVINGKQYYISPHNPNLGISDKDAIDINTDEIIKNFVYYKDNTSRYTIMSIMNKQYFIHVLKAYAMLQVPKDLKYRNMIDHKDRNGNNNSISNLRFVTPSQNSIGQGNMNNNVEEVKIEVYDLKKKEIVHTFYSLRSFMVTMETHLYNEKSLDKKLAVGPFKGRYIWRNNSTEDWESILKRCSRHWVEVYQDGELLETIYGLREFHAKYCTNKKVTMTDCMINARLINRHLTFKHSDPYIAPLNNEEFEVYNPITKDSQHDKTLRALAKKMGWNGSACINMVKNGNDYVNGNGYICAKKGTIDYNRKDYKYTLKLDKHCYDGVVYDSLRQIAKELGIDRTRIHLSPRYELKKYSQLF